MIRSILLSAAVLLFSGGTLAGDAPEDGLSDVSFAKEKKPLVRKALNKQAEKPAKGGELSATLYIKSQERLADSFDQAIPATLGESTRE